MYESPINRICGEINNEIIRKDEEHLMTIITQQVGYQLDKTELIKALNYDRNQYQKGYNDALNKIYADIQKLRGCSCGCSDGIIDDVEDIIDKYRAESEE